MPGRSAETAIEAEGARVRTEDPKGMRALESRNTGRGTPSSSVASPPHGGAAGQAPALGRADTSACQRCTFVQSSGTGQRAAPAAKSTVQSAVMSAIEKVSPAT